jgi:hypothetical protein
MYGGLPADITGSFAGNIIAANIFEKYIPGRFDMPELMKRICVNGLLVLAT